MANGDPPVLVYATFPDLAAAESMAVHLVTSGLCACVNIVPGMVSIYRWQGKVEKANEVVTIVKTRGSLAEAIIMAIKAQHPYELPAMLVLPVEGGHAPYIDWILANSMSATPANAQD